MRQEQKIIFAAISAKKQFSKRKARKNIFKATTAQETFSKRQTQQIHFKATSAKQNSDKLQKSISKEQTKNFVQIFWDFISNSVAENKF